MPETRLRVSNKRFAANLRVIMAIRDDTAADVCRATGIARATFSEHMKGKYPFSLIEIEAIIVDYLGWNLNDPATWARLLRPIEDAQLVS